MVTDSCTLKELKVEKKENISNNEFFWFLTLFSIRDEAGRERMAFDAISGKS
jgi:hypothetical protein